MLPNEQMPTSVFLLCRSALGLCALPLHHVRETMRALPCTPMPAMPDCLLGVAMIRGQAVPVVALSRLLGTAGGGGGARYVTLDIAGRPVALAVDEVIGVRTVPAAAMDDVPPLLQEADAGSLAAIATLDAALLLVLEAGRLIPDDLWASLAALEAA